jgi:hypothetical protein
MSRPASAPNFCCSECARRVSVAIGSPRRRIAERFRSPMHSRRIRVVALAALALLALHACAAERGYYELFTEALTNGSSGMIASTNLVNTNNLGPVIGPTVSFMKFRQGELAGIKLGMTMSQVVTAWGRPRELASVCVFGPRLWYGPGRWFGDLSLSFKGDRLVLIAIAGETAKRLTFDNGLSGHAGRTDFESLLGEPSVRDPQDHSLYNGQIAYRAGSLRTDFSFEAAAGSSPREQLRWAAVRIEAEAQQDHHGEQHAPPNGGPAMRPSSSSVTEGPPSVS